MEYLKESRHFLFISLVVPYVMLYLAHQYCDTRKEIVFDLVCRINYTYAGALILLSLAGMGFSEVDKYFCVRVNDMFLAFSVATFLVQGTRKAKAIRCSINEN